MQYLDGRYRSSKIIKLNSSPMKNLFSFPVFIACFFLMSAFSIDYNGLKKLPKFIRNHYAFIPVGEVMIEKKKSEVGSFYISKTEVSNLEYQEFLHDLKRRGENEKLQIAGVDTSKWIINGTYNEPFATTYHRHHAYHDYPVVNITKTAAELYCQWLGEVLTENNPGFIFEARLPRRREWVRAARPTHLMAPYSWGGYYLQNGKGQILCNFRKIGAESVAFDEQTNSYIVKDVSKSHQVHSPAPVNSFMTTDGGLRHMNGNVAELTSEGLACGGSWFSTGYDVRIESVIEVHEASPFVGFRPLLNIKAVE